MLSIVPIINQLRNLNFPSIKMNRINAQILQLVQQHFPEFREKELQEEIATVGVLKKFPAKERILDFGAYIKLVPLVVDGSVKVVREDEEKDQELFLYNITPGETCSMSFTCCMMNKRSDIRTTAEKETLLIGIPIKYVDQWMMKYQSWKNFVMRSYDRRMQELIQTIDLISFHNMDERLLLYLQKKSSKSESGIIETTHQQIASDLNASREAVSRLLKKLEGTGKIQLGRNKIKLL